VIPKLEFGVPVCPPESGPEEVGRSRSKAILAETPFNTTDAIATLVEVLVNVHGFEAVPSGLDGSLVKPVLPLSINVQVPFPIVPKADPVPVLTKLQVAVLEPPPTKLTVTCMPIMSAPVSVALLIEVATTGGELISAEKVTVPAWTEAIEIARHVPMSHAAAL
jgi:hypothetical protein